MPEISTSAGAELYGEKKVAPINLMLSSSHHNPWVCPFSIGLDYCWWWAGVSRGRSGARDLLAGPFGNPMKATENKHAC